MYVLRFGIGVLCTKILVRFKIDALRSKICIFLYKLKLDMWRPKLGVFKLKIDILSKNYSVLSTLMFQ